MRPRGVAIFIAVLACFLQAGPVVACSLACGQGRCPMQPKESHCCDAESPECKCAVSAPVVAPASVVTFQLAFAEFTALAPSEVRTDIGDSPAEILGYDEGGAGPPGVSGFASHQERAPPVA